MRPAIPAEGGTLHFSDRGTAGCVRCGWSGIPTSVLGVVSDWCPVCTTPMMIDRIPRAVSTKVARNAPCPCGSGRKAKKCCHG